MIASEFWPPCTLDFSRETRPEPIRASQDEIRNQIFAAAQDHGLNFFILLSYLGLNSAATYDQRPQ